jgi:putative phosphoesterase
MATPLPSLRIGVVSDTHGLLRPRVLELLAGCSRILHAGDVGDPAILAALAALTPGNPVTAVRGNVDTAPWADDLPVAVHGELGGLPFAMTHRREDVEPAWVKRSRVVIFGHSHRPELSWQGPCLLLNSGAAGAPRFHLPLTLAILTVAGERVTPEILAVA